MRFVRSRYASRLGEGALQNNKLLLLFDWL